MLKSLYTWLIIVVSVLTIHGAAVPTSVTLCELVKRALASNNGSGDIQQQVLREICIDPAIQLADQEQLSLDAVYQEMGRYKNFNGADCVAVVSTEYPVHIQAASWWTCAPHRIAVHPGLGAIRAPIRDQAIFEWVSAMNVDVWSDRWAQLGVMACAISFLPNGSLAPAVQDWILRQAPTNAGAGLYSVSWSGIGLLAGLVGVARRPMRACGQEAVMRLDNPDDVTVVLKAQIFAEDTQRLSHDIETIVGHPEPMESSAIRTLRNRHEHLSRSPYAPNQN